MRKRTYLILLVTLFLQHRISAQKTVSLHSLLTDILDLDAATRWPDPSYTLKQASSYDRRSVDSSKSGWFANGDQAQYIRNEENNGRREQVMMDADGPGAIVRFWLTTTKKTGILRIYFDNHADADIEIPAYDLMKFPFRLDSGLLDPHSSYNAVDKGGNTLYLPVPYSTHCKITLQETDGSRIPRYYQINYRTYPAGTAVSTFTGPQFEKERPLIAKVEYALWHAPDLPLPAKEKKWQSIAAGDSVSAEITGIGSAVRDMRFSLQTVKAEDYETALHKTWIKIVFDGGQTVLCPLDDFAGSGAGAHALRSWYREVKGNSILSRWIMPFRKNVVISFVNKSSVPVSVNWTAKVEKYTWNDRSMYFHAGAQSVNDLPVKKTDELSDSVTPKSPNAPPELNFCRVSGKGVYMGHTLNVFNKMHYWYGEGDQKIWTDKGNFPAEFGTGTEDYYNTSWAPVVLYQTAFANAPRADNADSYGWNAFTRTRILDAVPFLTDFSLDWEALGWRDGRIDISTVTYWYQK